MLQLLAPANPDVMYLKVIGFGNRTFKVQNRDSYGLLRDLCQGDTIAIMNLGWLTVEYQSSSFSKASNAMIRTIVCSPMRLDFDEYI